MDRSKDYMMDDSSANLIDSTFMNDTLLSPKEDDSFINEHLNSANEDNEASPLKIASHPQSKKGSSFSPIPESQEDAFDDVLQVGPNSPDSQASRSLVSTSNKVAPQNSSSDDSIEAIKRKNKKQDEDLSTQKYYTKKISSTNTETSSESIYTLTSKDLRAMHALRALHFEAAPIEYYEMMLYDCGSKMYRLLKNKAPQLDLIREMFPLRYLLAIGHQLDQDELEDALAKYNVFIEKNPTYKIQYALLQQIFELTAGVLVKWRELSGLEYAYRTSVFSERISMLDIEFMAKDYISMSSMWMSSIIDTPIMKELRDQQSHDIANYFNSFFGKFTEWIIRINKDCDFDQYPSIAPLLANKSIELQLMCNIEPDPYFPEVPYVKLTPPDTSGKCCCCNNEQEYEAFYQQFMHKFVKFESVYRDMEKSFVLNVAHCENLLKAGRWTNYY